MWAFENPRRLTDPGIVFNGGGYPEPRGLVLSLLHLRKKGGLSPSHLQVSKISSAPSAPRVLSADMLSPRSNVYRGYGEARSYLDRCPSGSDQRHQKGSP